MNVQIGEEKIDQDCHFEIQGEFCQIWLGQRGNLIVMGIYQFPRETGTQQHTAAHTEQEQFDIGKTVIRGSGTVFLI